MVVQIIRMFLNVIIIILLLNIQYHIKFYMQHMHSKSCSKIRTHARTYITNIHKGIICTMCMQQLHGNMYMIECNVQLSQETLNPLFFYLLHME